MNYYKLERYSREEEPTVLEEASSYMNAEIYEALRRVWSDVTENTDLT